MSVNETLQQLAQRRMRQLGGSNGPLSTRQVWLRGGESNWSYETARRIIELGHNSIGDRIADTLSVALDVPVSHILAAAQQLPRLGRFELPRRADRLTDPQRAVVLGVVNAILDAGGDVAPRPARRGQLRALNTPLSEPGATVHDIDEDDAAAYQAEKWEGPPDEDPQHSP